MYIYYHGNNLVVFGITKGARDEELKNEGLKRPDEIDPTLVDPRLIAQVKKQEEIENQMGWDEMMRQAMHQAQKDTYRLHQAGEISDTVFDHTPEAVMDQIEDENVIDLDFFNSLNGF